MQLAVTNDPIVLDGRGANGYAKRRIDHGGYFFSADLPLFQLLGG